MLAKSQSFSTLRGADVPPIQAYKYSHLGEDPESDALEYENYQEQQAKALDAVSGISGSSVTAYGDDGGAEESAASASGTGLQNGEMGVCPVCGRSFRKRSSNQIYDSEDCRRRAHGTQR